MISVSGQHEFNSGLMVQHVENAIAAAVAGTHEQGVHARSR
jgi:hypothetical protein